MKKGYLIFLILIIFLFGLFWTIFWYLSQRSSSEEAVYRGENIHDCVKDEDCLPVSTSWCRYIYAINKNWYGEWKERDQQSYVEKKQERRLCQGLAPWEKLEYATAFCQDRKCQIKYDEDIINEFNKNK
ncbi:MAG: hypothetical protein U5L76_03095 [Patescibacteria group bacterium]|nr:hypothetical protein [Patescibacteria group bacterium]